MGECVIISTRLGEKIVINIEEQEDKGVVDNKSSLDVGVGKYKPIACSREHKEVQEQAETGETGSESSKNNAKFANEKMIR